MQGAEGFQLTVVHDPETELFVYGSITNPVRAAFPDYTVTPVVLQKADLTAAHTIQFAFLSALVEPPLLDGFIDDIHRLIGHLDSFA